MILALLLLAGGISEVASPATPEEAFRAAESLYQRGRYAEAAVRFEEILARGIDDGVVHYNLANAYFKDGTVGRAVVHYERALRRMPADGDARLNLEYVRERIRDEGSEAALPSFAAWIVRLYGKLGPSFWAFLLSLSFVSGGAALSFSRLAPLAPGENARGLCGFARRRRRPRRRLGSRLQASHAGGDGRGRRSLPADGGEERPRTELSPARRGRRRTESLGSALA